MLDIHKPGVLNNIMRQVNQAVQMQPQIQLQQFLMTLTQDEKEKYNERVHRLVSFGGKTLTEAQWTTMQSIINMRKYAEAQEKAGKTLSEGMQQIYDQQMLQVVKPDDVKEIEEQQAKDKFGSLKKA